MDISKAFRYVFEDENWVARVLIGTLLSLIPLVGIFMIFGYMLKIAENVAQGMERPLPEWNDFGDLLVRGLYALVISLVYSLPLLVIVFGMICAMGVIVGGAANTMGEEAGGLVAAVGILLYVLFIGLMIVGSVLISIVVYAAMARYVATKDFGSALRIGEVLGMVRQRPMPWVMVLVVSILAGLVASLGIIACGIGVLFTSMLSYCFLGHALGQAARAEIVGVSAESYPPPSATSF
ncbi:MAG TPA: DUF4013 domain-containing protein [Roseiflexaceae bacterium]|nr:DUF4013 domain-containing protein [Roseiflexaceae bacterium]HMP42943.1 DUF4013 domain-containing protein [Roseiflexaceae bacterium]